MFQPERTYQHLARLGVKWARVQTGWARTEQTRGKYDFAWLDAVVDSLREIGVQPWFNLGYGNQLYTPKAPDKSAVGWAPVFDAEAMEGWVRYTQAIAEHFRDRVRHWEIWNEPNISGFWKPNKPSAADYVKLVKQTAPEIRKRVDGAVIVGGALAGMPTKYLEQCMEAGMGDYVDRISYHPYRPVPEKNYEPTVAAWRELLARYKPGIKLWQGENGCPSQPGSVGALRQYAWNETRQAKWLLRRILTDLRLGIELTSYFHLVDLMDYNWGSGPSGKNNYKGLLRGTDYTPKESFHAYQCLSALFDSKTRTSEVNPELVSIEGLAEHRVKYLRCGSFVRGGRAIYAYWFPATLQEGWTPCKLSAKVATPPDASIEKPLLVDPLTSRVYRLAGKASEGTLAVDNLPLLDYPLLVTDAAVVA